MTASSREVPRLFEQVVNPVADAANHPPRLSSRKGGQKCQVTRVFIVHGSEIVRSGLQQLLRRADDLVVVGGADSVSGTLRGLAIAKPDLVVIDAGLASGGVAELVRAARRVHPDANWLVLGHSDVKVTRQVAADARAGGYVLDDAGAGLLCDVIRRVAGGERMAMPQGEPATSGEAEDPAATPGLTPRESDVLALIAAGLTNRQIGSELGLAEKTVKNYVSTLLAKLHVERRTQAAIYEVNRASGR